MLLEMERYSKFTLHYWNRKYSLNEVAEPVIASFAMLSGVTTEAIHSC